LALPLVPTRARPAAPPKPAAADKAAPASPAPAPAANAPGSPAPALPDEPTSYQPNPVIMQGGSGGQGWVTPGSPHGKTLAVVAGGTGNNEGALTLYDLPSGKERVTLIEEKPIRCVAFSPDGKLLATGGFTNLAELRDPKTGAVKTVLRGHTGGVN